MTEPELVVFAGLPGVGKTSLAREVASRAGATFLRVDTIEATIVSTLMPFSDNPVGYVVAARVALDQLRAGRSVVIDAVNALEVARRTWVDLAREGSATLTFVEVTCSDLDEHRRRVVSRAPEMPGQGIPTWEQVRQRRWEPFTRDRLVIDNVGDGAAAVERVLSRLAP